MRIISKSILKAYKLSDPKVLEPKASGGVRDAKEVENFLLDIDLFFKACRN